MKSKSSIATDTLTIIYLVLLDCTELEITIRIADQLLCWKDAEEEKQELLIRDPTKHHEMFGLP